MVVPDRCNTYIYQLMLSFECYGLESLEVLVWHVHWPPVGLPITTSHHCAHDKSFQASPFRLCTLQAIKTGQWEESENEAILQVGCEI